MPAIPGLAADAVAQLLTLNVKRPDGTAATAFGAQAAALKEMRSAVIELLDRVAALEAGPAPAPAPVPVPVPVPAPVPPPVPLTLAPQTYNRGSGGQDARYCVAGLARGADGVLTDGPFRYDDDGLALGGRSGNTIPGLKPSDMMDDKGPCDPYEWQGRRFPPWPLASYLR